MPFFFKRKKTENPFCLFVCFENSELREQWKNLGHIVWPEGVVQILVLCWGFFVRLLPNLTVSPSSPICKVKGWNSSGFLNYGCTLE